jgi:hypothetical protein
MTQFLERLPERERIAVEMRWGSSDGLLRKLAGLDVAPLATYAQIAARIGRHRSNAQAHERKGIRRLYRMRVQIPPELKAESEAERRAIRYRGYQPVTFR